ncbi:MAG: hypothetical protein CM15mP21_5350 [Hyphomicrobiales bacterium]|nr:MAG: hypothetical protein CM15mP21_5350 [Hyphomicrobiales bacterium]
MASFGDKVANSVIAFWVLFSFFPLPGGDHFWVIGLDTQTGLRGPLPLPMLARVLSRGNPAPSPPAQKGVKLLDCFWGGWNFDRVFLFGPVSGGLIIRQNGVGAGFWVAAHAGTQIFPMPRTGNPKQHKQAGKSQSPRNGETMGNKGNLGPHPVFPLSGGLTPKKWSRGSDSAGVAYAVNHRIARFYPHRGVLLIH